MWHLSLSGICHLFSGQKVRTKLWSLLLVPLWIKPYLNRTTSQIRRQHLVSAKQGCGYRQRSRWLLCGLSKCSKTRDEVARGWALCDHSRSRCSWHSKDALSNLRKRRRARACSQDKTFRELSRNALWHHTWAWSCLHSPLCLAWRVDCRQLELLVSY